MFATPVAPGGQPPLALSLPPSSLSDNAWLLLAPAVPLGLLLLSELLGLCRVPRGQVGIVVKRWSGVRPEVLGAGFHLGLWRWCSTVTRTPLVVIEPGKLGYVYARVGQPLAAGQSLACAVECDHFQDVASFLVNGQRGRQTAVLREGRYALNLALFAVLTEKEVFFQGPLGAVEKQKLERWHRELTWIDGFAPVVVETRTSQEGPMSVIGVVTVHEGPSLPAGERIAAEVETHQGYQDVAAFLKAGGRRGRQAGVLGRGVYYINRWFATVELLPGERVGGSRN